MKTEELYRIIAAHKLFHGLDDNFLQLLAGNASNVMFHAGDYLFHEGEMADNLYLIRQGHVRLEISAPGHGSMIFQTVGPEEIIGVTMLVPPHRWTFDARATELTRAIAIGSAFLRSRCDADPGIGYEMMKRFMPVIVDRLHSTRVQSLDVYGKRS